MVRHDLVVSFVLGLGLALVVSALPAPQVASLESPSVPAHRGGDDVVLVRGANAAGIASELGRLGIPTIDSYETSVLARVPPHLRVLLEQRGLAIESIPDRTITGRGLFTFDTTRGEPRMPSFLRSEAPEAGDGLYIVQFAGPVKGSWIEDLRGSGAEVIEYLPSHAYLVRMDASEAARVAHGRAVEWVGVYHPGYKIAPDLLWADHGIVRISVNLVRGASTEPLLDAIAASAGTLWAAWSDWQATRVQADVPVDAVPALARVRDVTWIDRVGDMTTFNRDATWVTQSGDVGLGRTIHDRGLRGEGQLVTFADSGLDWGNADEGDTFGHEMFVDGFRPPGDDHRKVRDYFVPRGAQGNQIDDNGHGTFVAGVLAGDAPDNVNGTVVYGTYNKVDGHAFLARLIVEDIANRGGSSVFPSPNLFDMFGPALTRGSHIHTNSWGGPPYEYVSASQMIDAFVWSNRTFLILFAAGNSGPSEGTISALAQAKNMIAVGATNNSVYADRMAIGSAGRYFSGRGPTPDGRLKPTLLAPGSSVCSSIRTEAILQPGETCESGIYVSGFGTSFSTPAVAAAAALIRQYLEEGWYPAGVRGGSAPVNASAALVRAMLINSAEEIIGADAYGHTSAPSPHVLELSADVSRSAPSSLHVLKCGPAVTTCASGDDLTDLYVHAAFSPRITEVNYSADYSLEVDVYVAPGTSAWNMVILDDGRARVDLGSSGPGYVLSLVGSNGAWTRSIGSGWHSILIFYRPAQGIYRAAVDGTSVGPGASIGFVGVPRTRVVTGTPLNPPTPGSNPSQGDYYLDDLQYFDADVNLLWQDTFDDGDVSDWSFILGPRPEYRYPNNHQGWGRVLLEDALSFEDEARKLWFEDEAVGLTTGASRTYRIAVTDAAEPLDVTLAWTDYPGTPGAVKQLVNDLDLTVTDPFGRVYRGNVFPTYATLEDKLANPGQSAEGGAADRVNVEEGVLRLSPAKGVWTITVAASEVALGGSQAYALVVTGAIDTTLRTLASLPWPYVADGALSGSVVVGASGTKTCKKRTVASGASTTDDIGGVLIAGALGNRSATGLVAGLLDTEATTPCASAVLAAGDVFGVGRPAVSLFAKTVNHLLPVRFAGTGDGTGQGIYASESGRNYVRTTYPDGRIEDYGLLSMLYDAANGRFFHVLAGLTPSSTRAMSELVARDIMLDRPIDAWGAEFDILQGTGIVVRFVDMAGDGPWEMFQLVDGTGGVVPMQAPAPFSQPVFIPRYIVLGESSAHLGLAGANMMDAAAAIPLAVREARAFYTGPLWALLDTEAVNPQGTAITFVGNLLSVGPKEVNAVSKIINSPYLSVRFVDRKGICTMNLDGSTRTCYKASGTYGKGTAVTDYAMDSLGFLVNGQAVQVVAGLSTFATRGAAQAIAAGTIALTGQGIVIRLVDTTGDGRYESVTVVDSA